MTQEQFQSDDFLKKALIAMPYRKLYEKEVFESKSLLDQIKNLPAESTVARHVVQVPKPFPIANVPENDFRLLKKNMRDAFFEIILEEVKSQGLSWQEIAAPSKRGRDAFCKVLTRNMIRWRQQSKIQYRIPGALYTKEELMEVERDNDREYRILEHELHEKGCQLPPEEFEEIKETLESRAGSLDYPIFNGIEQ